MHITHLPLAASEYKPFPSDLTFGRHFSNRMFTQHWTAEQGWHEATIGPYRPFTLDPATAVLHYGQEIFEGTKAYRRPDGGVNLFRPWENAARFNRSAERMAMQPVDPEEHVEAMIELVRAERDWVPSQPGASLYIRPTLIATEVGIAGLSSNRYLHYIIVGPVGPYFPTGFKPVSVFISDEYVRAVRGGVGAAKTGLNYAASLYVAEQVKQRGYQQVLWLDALEHRYLEEVGAMNIALVYGGKDATQKEIVTPPLTGSFLPGITRDSMLKLAPDLGYTVAERAVDVHEMLRDIQRGEISEAFGLGTAAVVAPISKFGYQEREFIVGSGQAGPVANHLYQSLTDIQYGRAADVYGWTVKI